MERGKDGERERGKGKERGRKVAYIAKGDSHIVSVSRETNQSSALRSQIDVETDHVASNTPMKRR